MLQKHFLALVTVLLVLVPAASTQAGLPPDQAVEFLIRKTPSDPNSQYIWTITAELHAVAQVGEDYQWDIIGVEIRKLGVTPEYDEVWYDAMPIVDTVDGYWWVAFDGNVSDFRQLPPIYGFALNDDPAGLGLYYDFIGGPPGPGTEDGTLSSTFQREGEEEPEKDDPDEPAEVPDGVRDPLQTPQ